jgi:hypothetical protein
LAKFRNTWGKASDRLRQRANKRNKTVSDIFRHRSGTGKSYCRTRFNVGSERVKNNTLVSLYIFSGFQKGLFILSLWYKILKCCMTNLKKKTKGQTH